MSESPARRIPPVRQIRRRTRLAAWLIALTFAGTFAVAAPVSSWAAAATMLESNYVRLVFSNPDDIARLNKKIDFGDSGGWFSSSAPASVEQRLLHKIDAIYDKVQHILDMRKPPQQKIVLRVARDDDELAAIFLQVFKRKGSARAWYVYEYNTVYINARDINEGIIAHEFAHSVIDHYFAARPPRASAEILATYVDKYLFDDVRQRNDFQ